MVECYVVDGRSILLLEVQGTIIADIIIDVIYFVVFCSQFVVRYL